MKAVLKYPGAKNRIAPWIVSFIPEHTVYLEPFAGSLAVFFNKPKSHIETINDINGDVVNFFKVLRSQSEEFIEAMMFTPFSRKEYDNYIIMGLRVDNRLIVPILQKALPNCHTLYKKQ